MNSNREPLSHICKIPDYMAMPLPYDFKATVLNSDVSTFKLNRITIT